MRNRISNFDLFHLGGMALLFLLVSASHAAAHVMLDPASGAPGATIMAEFKVGHGCSGAATTGLQVELPDGVSDVMAHDKPGWTVQTRTGNGHAIVTWSGGSSAPNQADSFPVMFTLPAIPGRLIFPTTQICGAVQEHWTETGAQPLKRPAPVFMVAATIAPPPVTVSDAWIRALPGTVPSGGYFTLHNGGGSPLTLTGAQSPGCGMLMLHKSENRGGMSGMSDMPQVVVPAGGEVKFAPGGYHLMCMDAKSLKPGTQVPVTLQFADGSRATAQFMVRNAAGK